MSHQQFQLCLSYIRSGKQSTATAKGTPTMNLTATANSDTWLKTKGDGHLRLWTYSDTDICNIYIQRNIMESLVRVLLLWRWHPRVLPQLRLNTVPGKKARVLIPLQIYLFLDIWYIYSAQHSKGIEQSGQSIQVPTTGHSPAAAIPQGMHYADSSAITHGTWNKMHNINHYKMNPMMGEKMSWGSSRSGRRGSHLGWRTMMMPAYERSAENRFLVYRL